MKHSIIGTVQDIKGSSVSIKITSKSATGLTYINGSAYKIGQVGSLIKVQVGSIFLYGMVTQAGIGALPDKSQGQDFNSNHWLSAELVGQEEYNGKFTRGVSQSPSIGDLALIVTIQDQNRIYSLKGKEYIYLGSYASSSAVKSALDINKLVCRHTAVLGSTGAGKSTTVAKLIYEMCGKEHFPRSRSILIDVHGEYQIEAKGVNVLKAINKQWNETLYMPYWALTFEEFFKITFDRADDTYKGHVRSKVIDLKNEYIDKYMFNKDELRDELTADTPIPFSVQQLWYDLWCEANATFTESHEEKQSSESWALEHEDKGDAWRIRPPSFKPNMDRKVYLSKKNHWKSKVEYMTNRLRDKRFDFLFRPGPWSVKPDEEAEKDLDALLDLWIGFDSRLTILDVSGIPNNALEDLVGSILRILFDSLFWMRKMPEGGQEWPIAVILEEAHLYLDSGRSSSSLDSVRRILKEGRKYGIGSIITSQRPSELDATILSQCGTMIGHRMNNSSDRGFLSSMTIESMGSLTNLLPTLRTGEAIILGEATHLPSRILIDSPPLDWRPKSQDPPIADEQGPGSWLSTYSKTNFSEAIYNWRIKSAHKFKGAIMIRQSVNSSNLNSVGYEPENHTLEIEFKNGRVYQYFDVPDHEYDQLMNSPSHGQYFAQNIRDIYRYNRIT